MNTLTVPGTLDSITQITDFVAVAASQAGLSEKTSYYLCLAVDEIATNVVLHGYQAAGRAGDLMVTAVSDDQHLSIYLEDTGRKYDPRQTPLPDVQRPLHERELGGLGVYLALRSVDKFDYEHKQGRNRSTFIIRKP
jgi:anti-sigma regulatory factor (Ser/Thr protein kinase)